jgi:hypothetical protein
MSQQIIGQGPGNLVPNTETLKFKCTAAIPKGSPVFLSPVSVTDAKGTSYVAGCCITKAVVQADVIGVANELGADGDWIEVTISGLIPYLLTDGSVAEGQLLVPTAASLADGVAVATGSLLAFGMALDADTAGNLLVENAVMFKRI